jgi:HlyD family secretion protein
MRKITLILLAFGAVVFWGCGNSNNKNTIAASGDIEATDVVVSSQVNGNVLSILKDEGQKVNAGDTIIILDHETYDYQLEQAEASSEAAEAQLELLKQGARKEDIQQGEDALKQAQINLNLAETNKDRMTKLYESNSITKKQYDDAVAAYNVAASQANAASENLTKLKNYARPEEIKQAEANVNKAAAAVKLLKKSVRDCYVTSPINGFIVNKYVEKGETVTMLSSLFKVSDLNPVKLDIYVSEDDLGKIKLGQKADVTTDTYQNKKYEGKVIYISPEAEFTPKNIQTKDERTKLVFEVKIQIDNSNFELKPGMPADAIVHL